ncbi:MAG: hypothetical protein ACF788_01030, partial [Novipirellula sp. JB048]
MLQRPLNHFRSVLLDKLVLRPTRDRVDPGTQRRVVLTSRFGPLETFGLANYPDPDFTSPAAACAGSACAGGAGGAGCRDASHPTAGGAEVGAAGPPELLLLKFPGTAGRAERSSLFPADLMPDVRTHVWTWNP